jgi:hypothetical protein
VVARNVRTSQDVAPELMMRVFFRPGAPGVLDMRRTAQEFVGTPETQMGADLDGAEFALEMIRFPYRQVFGDPDRPEPTPIADVFRPTLAYGLQALEARFREAVT